MNSIQKLLLPVIFALALISTAPVAAVEIKSTLSSIEFRLSQASGDYDKLAEALVQVNRDLFAINPLELDITLEKLTAKETIERLSAIKKSVRVSLIALPQSFPGRGEISENLKTVLTSLRFMEDYYFEFLSETQFPKLDKKSVLPFSKNNAFAQYEDSFKGDFESLKSGDVLVMRSAFFLGSMISRIGNAPQTYSHMALVYVDSVTKKKYIIESTLNTGFQKKEITPKLFANQARLGVYRPKDAELGKLAGEFGNEQYESAIKAGKPLQYDLSMGLEENCKYYCSKFVSWAYNSVLKKKVIPEFPSRLQLKNGGYLESLGVPKSSLYTYAPSDIDLDSTFDLIYEFRNPFLTTSTRLDDMITDKVLYWLRTENLELVPGKAIDRVSLFVTDLVAIPFVRRMMSVLRMHLSTEITPKSFAILVASTFLVRKFKTAVVQANEAYLEKNGVPMAPKEIYAVIEQIRKDNPEYTKQLQSRGSKNMCFRLYSASFSN